jgi:phosphatidylglycerol:prolipoprotein diacylglycerol transferase
MHPILIKIGPITIHTYGFLLAIGVLSGIGIVLLLAKKEKLDTRVVADFVFYAILVGLVGAKVWYLVTELGYYLKHPGEIPGLITAAGTFYGGLIFGAAFVIWYVRKHQLDFKVIGDVLGPGVALAHFFGRMGCFAAGCCWGRTAEGCSVAVEFTSPGTTTGVPRDVPLYPTQLMESLLNLLNFVILLIFFKHKKFNGQVLSLYIFNYSLIRFIVEFFRGDGDRGYIFGGVDQPFVSLSVPQLVSLLGIAAAIILYTRFKKKKEEKK